MVAANGRMGCRQEGGGELEAYMSEQSCCIIILPYNSGKTIDSSICSVYSSTFFVRRLGKSEVNIAVIPVQHQLSAGQHPSHFLVTLILLHNYSGP